MRCHGSWIIKLGLGVALVLGSPVDSQTLSLTAPSPSTTIGGAAFKLTSTCTACPALYTVEYLVDNDSEGLAYGSTNFALSWNTFNDANGPHSVLAVARDAAGATIATSPAVSFTTANSQAYSGGSATFNAGVTVTPSCTSNCSATITFAIAVSGTYSSFGAFTHNVFVDGQNVTSDGACGNIPCNATETIDTRNYYDGPHQIRVEGAQGIDGESHDYGWQQTITFSNGSSVPVALNASAHEIFLQPGGTYTLSGRLYNADGSVVASPTLQFLSLNPAVATVDQNSGLVTAVGSAPNSVRIGIMSQVTTGTNLHVTSITGNTANVLGSFVPSMKGNMIQVTSTGSGGCTLGLYQILSAGTGSASVSPPPGTAGTTGCNFTTGPSRYVWTFIHASNAIAHLSRGGGILTSYSPTASFWHDSIFFNAQTFNTYPNWCADYNAAGYNTLEFELEYSLPASISQSTWTTSQQAYTMAQQATAQACNSYLHGIMDSWWRGDTEMYNTTRGPSVQGAGTWSIPPLTILMQTLANANTCTPTLTNKCFGSYVYTSRYDEFSTTWGTSAYFPNPISFTSGITNIVCNGTTCTVTWPGWSMSALGFAITGATTAGLNTPACPTSPGYYTATNISSTQFSFPSTAASGTYNNSTDPGLTIEPLAHGCHTPPGGSSATDFTRYNAFANVMNWMTGTGVTGNRPIGTWTNPALTSPLATLSTGGNPNMADNTDQYINESSTVTLYKPSAEALYTLPGDIGDNFQRLFVPSFQDGKPSLMPNTPALSAFYTFAGYPCTVTSFIGNTVTCSAPHGIYNVLPGTTRIQLTGMSNGADNGKYPVISAPTSTTLTVYELWSTWPTTPASHGGNFNMVMANGTKVAGVINATTTSAQWSANDSIQGCNIANNRGATFTINGTGLAVYDGNTFFYPAAGLSDTPCSANLQANFFPIPNGSSTSGTATITPDNWAHRGLSDMGVSPGALYHYAAINEAVILRMAGTRSYPVIGFDPQYFNWGTTTNTAGVGAGAFSTAASTANSKYNNWTDFPNNAEQFGPYAGSIGNGAIGEWVQDWWAIGLANLQAEAKAKWIFKPSLNSPDIGIGFECAARGDSGGNLVLCQSFWNNTRTITIPTSAYLQSGQPFIQDYCTYLGCAVSSVAAGTTWVSLICAPGCTVWLRFPTNAAAEWNAPTLSIRLADVTNAARVVVQYAYTPFPMTAPTGQGLLNSFDCGTGTCSLPVDLRISQLYYRLLYLDSSGAVLAASDIQTVAQLQ
jgi:hypothetical protein